MRTARRSRSGRSWVHGGISDTGRGRPSGHHIPERTVGGVRNGPGRGDWGNIDWSKVDLPGIRRSRGPRPPRNRLSTIVTIVILALFLLPLVFSPLVGFLTDLLWFRSLGLEDVFLRRYTAGFWAFIVFLLAFFFLALPNLYFALRPQVPRLVVETTPARRTGALSLTLRLMPFLLVP